MRNLLKTAFVWSFLALFSGICLAEDAPQQELAAVPKPERFRLLVTDCLDKSSRPDAEAAQAATGALYIALERAGNTPFEVISRQEVWVAAERLGLPVPEATAPSGHWTEEEKLRLCKALHADMLCKGQTYILKWSRSSRYTFCTDLIIQEVISQIPRVGGFGRASIKSLPAAITQSVNEAARECTTHRLSTTVLSCEGDTANLGLGIAGDMRVGDEWEIVREVGGKRISVGRVKIARLHLHDSEGTIIADEGGIKAGDSAISRYVIIYDDVFGDRK